MQKIPCPKCKGRIVLLFGIRLVCKKCGQHFGLHKLKKTKRKIEKKCAICGKKFYNNHSRVKTCSKKHSIQYRKNWFKKYNKSHKKQIRKSRRKYEKFNRKKRDYKKEYSRFREIRKLR